MIKHLNELLNKDAIRIIESVSDWKAAINQSAEPLLRAGNISPQYVEAIFKAHEKLGPYYVLGPKIAMPHARPEEGALDIGLSMLVIKNGVNFNSKHNDPVHLVVMLSATDANSHLGLLQKLAELFSEENDIDAIINAANIDEVISIINKY